MVTDGVARVRHPKRVVDLLVLPGGADEYRRRTQPPDRKQGGDKLRPVGSHYRDPLTCDYTGFGQGHGQPVGQRVELTQAQSPFLEHERGRHGHVLFLPAA